MEEWREVPGFEGYEVSSEGRVRSLDRDKHAVRKQDYVRNIKGCILKPKFDQYNRVALYKDSIRHFISIHRLVALAFIPQIEGKPEIDHINRDKLDNRVSNLRWVDDSEQGINRHHPLPSTGERNISETNQKTFRLMIKRNGKYIINKTFKTLEEAKAFRDSTLLSYTVE